MRRAGRRKLIDDNNVLCPDSEKDKRRDVWRKELLRETEEANQVWLNRCLECKYIPLSVKSRDRAYLALDRVLKFPVVQKLRA
jgi:hypothetical protein